MAVNGNGFRGGTERGKHFKPPKPIAICGMALRLPGGLTTPQQFWEFLLSKGDARSRVPPSRYNISAYHGPSGTPGTVGSEYGYFLDEAVDLGSLDASFFSMARSELERTDPHHRQMLEVARECLEDAGEVGWRGKSIGCYMGSFGEDWCEMFAKEAQQYGLYRVSGYGDFMLSNRVSYEMDLKGPSMTIRTGCSATLVALHEACQALERGECTSAIIGGANLIMAPGMTTAMTEQGVLSPDGSCKTFSADANGYARGEAINAIYIKPLRDALQDGNPIRAVIRSTATNSDGKTPGMSTPSAEAHEAMIRRAYDVAGISDLSQTAFVECHGTGTSTGDPLEVMAVGKVFGDSGVYIGSVKPNLGHSEGASGLTSIIKSVLALEHQVIPPNIKFAKPNPNIAFASNKLTVPTEPTTWPKERCERVSVNSFGIGGSNAHAIIDSARSCNVAGPSRRVSNEPQLLVYSANSPESLGRQVRNIHDFLEENPETRGDLAYTLANRREHLPHRAFTVASRDLSTFTSPLAKAGPFPEVVMVFTGQGAQWPQMGRELIESNAVFRNSIRSMDRDLQDAADAPQWSIEDELLKPAKMSQIHRAELSQPLCTAIQIALVDCLATVGIEASAVVGHSSGELAAAYASGGITAREAITAASHRGMVTKKQNRSGSMAAIGMSWEETERYLVSGVVVACENSPKSVTISGDVDKLESVLVEIRKSQPEVMARLLKVDQAYHSYHMVEIGDAYHQLIKYRVAGKEPTKLFFSSVTGNLLNGQRKLDARYWQKNLESPVLFRTAVANLLQHPIGQNAVFVEVGPHSALAAPLRQILVQAKSTAPYVPVMIRDKNCIESFLTAIGQLYLLYVSIDFKKLIPTGSTLTDLPPYPWNHEHSYWYESRLSKEIRHRKYPYHELLGIRVAESTDFEPSWRNLLHLNNIGWVRDHKIRDDVVFPFAGYVAMVGEAVKQLSGIEEGFSLGHVVVSAALVLDEGKPMEIITSLRRHRLTDSLDSQWWEFSIASHNGSIWMKHCSGRVKAQAESTDADPEPTLYPRRVEPRKWYRMMRRVGLNYGPQFQGLTNVTAATTRQVAAADAVDTVVNDKSNHHIHPTTIDFFLQLFSVAVTQGISRKLHKIVVPTNVEELHINRCYSDVHMTASATSSLKGAICGEGECIAYGKAVLRMRGVKLSPLDDSPPVDRSDTHPTARLEWRPDIDFLDLKQIFPSSIDRESYTPVLDELTRTCVLESKRCLEQSTTGLSHMRKFRAWLDSQSQTMSSEPLVDLGEGTAFDKINHLMGMLSNTPAAIAGIAMYKIVTNIADIYSGKVEPLEILLSEETLTRLYDFMDDAGNKSPFIQLLAHSKPNLRVLEIGAGTGASTNKILKDLSLPNGRVMYSRYAYTDISSGFFVAAKERFKALPNMEFVALDISRDPAAQGFVDGSYDLVVATNVLHATRSLKETLMNVRKLLHPRGRLLLQEVCTNSKWVNYIFGVLPGWWLGDGDGRKDEPYVSPKRWESELVGAGFEGLDAAIMDAKEPFQLNAVMVAKPKMPTMLTKNVTLLTDDEVRLSGPIIQILEERGCRISRCTLGESPPKGQDVLALLDIDKPFFENIDSARYESFKTFITSLSGGGILWITRPSQIRCADPRYAQTIGVARTIRSEMSIDFATCEIDDVTASWDQVAQIFNKFQMREQDVSPRADFEYAICEGTANVGRYHPFSMDDELQATESSDIMTLDIGSHGRLSTLFWSQQTPTELAGDEVQVETYAVGVNFRDVLIALGVVEVPKAGLGLEAAGIIRSIGPEVTDLSVGDRVILLGTGCFSTSTTVSEQLCAKMPDDLSFEDGATMPCVYGTAIYSLIEVGRLEKGQSILIHSACGGVGIAALQVARMLGAELYATVGNDEKVQYLTDNFKLPRTRIFNSRNASFLTDLMRETQGKGVDVVLNSLSGELLHASWRCVAEFGKMIEIGKRDLLGAGRLDMDVFLANRSYCCVDLGEICGKKPAVCTRLLKSMLEYLQQGYIQPIRPTKIFGAAAIQESFRYMQKGQHIGKIVVALRNTDTTTKLDMTESNKNRKKTFQLDQEASYLLIGGLGGLGRAISTWMVEHGARHLIYLSRNAGLGLEDQSFFRELESLGCEIQVVKGSVSSPEDVRQAVNEANKPLKGILQMSLVLRDQAFPRMTYDEWNAATSAKVQGTWNLHHATRAAGANLDFFVLFSSISGVIGQPGQANYASANTFLDAFVQYRTNLNLPASAIDIGAVEDVGYVARNEGLLRKMKTANVYGLREQELLDALMLAMIPRTVSQSKSCSAGYGFMDPNQFVLGLCSTIPLSNPANRSIWKNDRRMAVYHNSVNAANAPSTASSNVLNSFLATARGDASILKAPESSTILANEIGKKLFDFLLKPEEDLDLTRPLAEIGMDSLIAIEMKSWWKQVFGSDISVLEMLATGTLEALGRHAAASLLKMAEEESGELGS